MKKAALIIGLLAIPVLLIAAGFYFNASTISSIGYVIFIFYVIMALRGKFTSREKSNPKN